MHKPPCPPQLQNVFQNKVPLSPARKSRQPSTKMVVSRYSWPTWVTTPTSWVHSPTQEHTHVTPIFYAWKYIFSFLPLPVCLQHDLFTQIKLHLIWCYRIFYLQCINKYYVHIRVCKQYQIDFNATQYLIPWNTMYFQQNKNKVIETITWLLICIR